MKRKPQLEMLKREKNAFGGDLFTTREGRKGRRPLDTRRTMHLVLRSTKAVKDWSFKRPENDRKIREILQKFSAKNGIRIVSAANVGNHIHLQMKLSNRFTYKPFIRGITSAIALAVTGLHRWNRLSGSERLKFWDCRPFTRIVESYKALLNLRDYLKINVLEGFLVDRKTARLIVKSGVFINTG